MKPRKGDFYIRLEVERGSMPEKQRKAVEDYLNDEIARRESDIKKEVNRRMQNIFLYGTSEPKGLRNEK